MHIRTHLSFSQFKCYHMIHDQSQPFYTKVSPWIETYPTINSNHILKTSTWQLNLPLCAPFPFYNKLDKLYIHMKLFIHWLDYHYPLIRQLFQSFDEYQRNHWNIIWTVARNVSSKQYKLKSCINLITLHQTVLHNANFLLINSLISGYTNVISHGSPRSLFQWIITIQSGAAYKYAHSTIRL